MKANDKEEDEDNGDIDERRQLAEYNEKSMRARHRGEIRGK